MRNAASDEEKGRPLDVGCAPEGVHSVVAPLLSEMRSQGLVPIGGCQVLTVPVAVMLPAGFRPQWSPAGMCGMRKTAGGPGHPCRVRPSPASHCCEA